jgi:hypothetical protein
VLSAAATALVAVSAIRLRLIGIPGRAVAIALAVSAGAALAALGLAPDDWTVAPVGLAIGLIGAGLLLATGAVPVSDVTRVWFARDRPARRRLPSYGPTADDGV